MTRSGSVPGAACPIPIERYPVVTMAHGGGGRLMNTLIGEMFVTAFSNSALSAQHDAADLRLTGSRIAMTTDSFVVRPLFFPGGDIGCLGVYGTVNDVAMAGARPRHLSLGLILEEGLEMETLWRVVQSIRDAALLTGVEIVTGDTKVVERGKGDGIYLNTTGIGVIEHDVTIAPRSVGPGDVVVLSGDLGRHGIAIMARREGLEFETTIESDCAPLVEPVLALLDAGVDVHCLRDCTRGGLGAAVSEIASSAGVTIELEESAIEILEDVRGACEILGLDPIHVACEGRFIAILPADERSRAIDILRRFPVSARPAVIGEIGPAAEAPVILRTVVGVSRVVDLPSGEQLPRIC